MTGLDEDLILLWKLSDVQLIADTHTSHVFRAKRDRENVIVKNLKPAGLDELTGLDYLRWRSGSGAVRIFETSCNAVLMQDAGTVTLKDLHRREGEDSANNVLRKTLPNLFQPTAHRINANLPTLKEYISELFVSVRRHGLGDLTDLLQLAASVAEVLLDTAGAHKPLHGDIHHENLVTTDGSQWLAIDPKGILGDPHYDVANLFANPDDDPRTVLNPSRASTLADMLSASLFLDRTRILKHAVMHSGASIAWSLASGEDLNEKKLRQRASLIPILNSLANAQ